MGDLRRGLNNLGQWPEGSTSSFEIAHEKENPTLKNTYSYEDRTPTRRYTYSYEERARKKSKAYAERYVFIGRAHEKENPTRRRDGRI
jgi:hypothetical protein